MNTNDKAPFRKNRRVPKGQKALRGRPLIYDQVKQAKWYSLTPAVIEMIRLRAEKQDLTESEALERLIRSIDALPLPHNL